MAEQLPAELEIRMTRTFKPRGDGVNKGGRLIMFFGPSSDLMLLRHVKGKGGFGGWGGGGGGG